MVYRFKIPLLRIRRYDVYLRPTRTPRLVEHDVLSRLSESRLGRIAKMLVVVEVRGRVEVFLLIGRIGAVGIGVLSCQVFR